MVESGETLFLDKEKLAQLMAIAKQTVKSTLDSALDPDSAVSGVDEHFVCMVCLMVVVNPENQCDLCENLTCASCITQWL